jgi:hypothetical protein
VLVAPVVPLLQFFRGSGSGATPHTLVWPIIAIPAMALVAWLALAFLLRNARTSALFVTLLTLATFGYFSVSDLADYLDQRVVIPVTYLVVAVCAGLIWRAGSRVVAWLTVCANVVFLATTLLLAGSIARDELRVARATSLERPTPLVFTSTRTSKELPDIYILILEGYARADVLRHSYGFENDLVAELRSLGFFVADEAAGNYAQMTQSLASALNLEYLPALLGRDVSEVNLRRRLGELITHNRVFTALHSAGYRIRGYESEYAFLRPQPADARPGPLVRFTNFEYRFYEASVFPRLLQGVGLSRGLIPAAVHRQHLRWVLDRLAAEPVDGDGRPTLVFAHLLMPHPPFAFDADGSARATRAAMAFNDGDQWHTLTRGSGERYEAGYLDAVRFLNSRIPGLVRQVLSRTTRPAIFYILSDHGPASRLRWEHPDASSVRERLGILLAARFPDGDPRPLHSRTTPVNAYRALLNRALGTALPMLDDRSYFSTWERLSEYADVTERVR